MFKRASKVTALLVAAASVMSMVPAMAADTVRLGTKDGTVKEGVSFKDGHYAYYGYRTDDSDTGIYYNSGSDKDALVKDAEDYELDYKNGKFGDKYVVAHESGNNDEYLIDLSNGKIADIDTPEDQFTTAQSRLISALKKTERYNGTSDEGYDVNTNSVDFQRLFTNQFGELWYQYSTSTSPSGVTFAADTNTTTAGVEITAASTSAGALYTGFTNANGKYVDASKKAFIKVYDERKQKNVTVENFGTTYKDEAIRANLLGLKALAQDKDYIYALAKVQVVYFNYSTVNGEKVYDYTGKTVKATSTEQYFVQKIAKAQGSTSDGAYLPKSTDSWQVDGDVNRVFEQDDDRDDAFKYLVTDGDKNQFTVKDGNLYVVDTTTDSGKVYAYKLKFQKDKVDTTGVAGLSKVDDVDVSVVIHDTDDDTDAEDYSIGTDGTIWAIHDGEVKVFDGKDFTTKYKVDRSFDRLDVYDADNLIAWEDGSDAYTTVNEGKKQTVTDGQVVDPNLVDKTTVKTGWVQEGSAWTFYDATGAKVAGNWVNDKGAWYYLKADGTMATGWTQVAGTWYFLNGSGAMQTGWFNDGGTWYFLKSSGAMATGWLNDSGTWYFLQSSGAMASNTVVDGYTLNGSGAWVQ